MTEKTTRAEIAISEYFCDCGAEMKPTGYTLTSYPPKYPHECANGHKTNLRNKYPRLVVRKVGENNWKSLG